MTHPEDLRVGNYVALVGCKRDRWMPGPEQPWWYEAEDVTFDGMPMKVVAISLPFLAVEFRGQRAAFDLRDWDVQRVDAKYVQAMLGASPQACGLKPQASEGLCPRCGDKLIQRYVQSARAFRLLCKNCDFDGGEVKAAGVFSS